MWGYDHAGMGLMGFGMILIWLVPVVLLVWFLSRIAAGRRGGEEGEGKPAGTPLEILDTRYARGEIGRAEYLERRTDLERKDAA